MVLISSNCSAPSNQTLSKLGAELCKLNSTLTKQSDSKSDKKDKFEFLESFSQTLTLYASDKYISNLNLAPSPTFSEPLK